jgi:hypothetical protein
MKKVGFSVTTRRQRDKYIISATKTLEKNMWYFPGPEKYLDDAVFEPSYNNFLFFKTLYYNSETGGFWKEHAQGSKRMGEEARKGIIIHWLF